VLCASKHVRFSSMAVLEPSTRGYYLRILRVCCIQNQGVFKHKHAETKMMYRLVGDRVVTGACISLLGFPLEQWLHVC
jgi:hypothetical protein